MLYSTMVEENWITVKLRGELMHEIDRLIGSSVRFGVKRYASRADFVMLACVKLLEEETKQKIKTVEVSAK